jgi:hypothetical protein
MAHTVILVTWEAEIGRITTPGQPRQKSLKTPSQWKNIGYVAHTCHPKNGGKYKMGESWSRPTWERSKLYHQDNHNKKGQMPLSYRAHA